MDQMTDHDFGFCLFSPQLIKNISPKTGEVEGEIFSFSSFSFLITKRSVRKQTLVERNYNPASAEAGQQKTKALATRARQQQPMLTKTNSSPGLSDVSFPARKNKSV